MIGCEEDAPGVVDQQQELEADGPLHGVDHIASLVRIRDDAATGLVLDVKVAPLSAGELIEEVLPGTIGGDRHGVAEEDCTGVGGQIGMGVEILGERRCLRAHRVPIVAAVGMELQVRHVARDPSKTFMVSRVVVTLPGAPKLLQ